LFDSLVAAIHGAVMEIIMVCRITACKILIMR
jgi:hypothetical protein